MRSYRTQLISLQDVAYAVRPREGAAPSAGVPERAHTVIPAQAQAARSLPGAKPHAAGTPFELSEKGRIVNAVA